MAMMEMDFEHFSALVDAIKALGYDEETAGDYAVLISVCHCFDENGMTLVLDDDQKVLATLDLRNYFGNHSYKND
jgi:hypothetical protein